MWVLILENAHLVGRLATTISKFGRCSSKTLLITEKKAHQLTALTEKLLYTEVGSRVATETDVDAVKYGLVNVRQFQIYQGLVSKEVSNCGTRLGTLDQV